MEQFKDVIEAAAKHEDQTQEPFSLSRPINWFRWTDCHEFDEALEELLVTIEASEKRTRRRSTKPRAILKNTLKALALDLYMAWKSDRRLCLGLSKNRNDYVNIKHYDGLTLSYQAVVDACKGLERLGYLTVKKGYYDKEKGAGKRTRILTTDKLISLLNDGVQLNSFAVRDWEGVEIIELRNTDKRPIPYKPSDFTKRASQNLRRINQCLSGAWIDLYITDDELEVLKERLFVKSTHERDAAQTIDFNARTLRRVFNNESWGQGGRFYGGWWQNIPRDYRKHIHINGKQTVELDYSGMHPAMLYAEVGEQPPADPYDMNLDSVDRRFKKVAFNALVNASSSKISSPDGYDPKKAGLTWKELLKEVEKRHPLLEKYFRSGYGLRLQKKDSDIAERVMFEFSEMNYPCLPVHDSFIVHHALADELKVSMEKAFQEMVRLPAKVDAKPLFEIKAPDIPHEIDMHLEESDFDGGEFKAYEGKRRDWDEYIEKLC